MSSCWGRQFRITKFNQNSSFPWSSCLSNYKENEIIILLNVYYYLLYQICWILYLKKYWSWFYVKWLHFHQLYQQSLKRVLQSVEMHRIKCALVESRNRSKLLYANTTRLLWMPTIVGSQSTLSSIRWGLLRNQQKNKEKELSPKYCVFFVLFYTGNVQISGAHLTKVTYLKLKLKLNFCRIQNYWNTNNRLLTFFKTISNITIK